MSKLPPPMLKVVRVAHRRAQVRELAQPAADLLHDVALRVVAAERAPGDRAAAGRAARRPSENVRSACGAMRTKALPWLTPPRNQPPAVARTGRTPGTCRSSASTARIASSMAARLVPSGAVTFTSNSASSTSLGQVLLRTSR